jgi:hypothetical protein
MPPVSEAEWDRFTAACAAMLASWWLNRQEKVAGGKPATSEEVRDDAARSSG